jgi:hypothetical protein
LLVELEPDPVDAESVPDEDELDELASFESVLVELDSLDQLDALDEPVADLPFPDRLSVR